MVASIFGELRIPKGACPEITPTHIAFSSLFQPLKGTLFTSVLPLAEPEQTRSRKQVHHF
jgi:hypothetical protein